MELVERGKMNIYQSNTYRNNLSWLHLDNEPRVQEKEEWKDQQLCIFNFAPYLTNLSSK